MPRNREPVMTELENIKFEIRKLTLTQLMEIYRLIGVEDATDIETVKKRMSLHSDVILREFFPKLCVSHNIGPEGDYDVDDFDFEEQTEIFNALLQGFSDLGKGTELAETFPEDRPG